MSFLISGYILIINWSLSSAQIWEALDDIDVVRPTIFGPKMQVENVGNTEETLNDIDHLEKKPFQSKRMGELKKKLEYIIFIKNRCLG